MMEPFIVHSHIPKTGGSSLNRRVLFPMYGEDRAYLMYRYVFETASRLPRRHIARAMRSFVAVGHVPYGYFEDVYPDAVYVSVFRDPVARFVSFLNFVLATPGHAVRQRLDRGIMDRATEDPDTFVAALLAEPRLSIVHQNVQTRLASGTARLGEAAVTEAHLDAALRNIQQDRYIVGAQEDMDDLIRQMQARFSNLHVGSAASAALEKRLKRNLGMESLPARTLDRIRAANALDLRLYDAVLQPATGSLSRAA